MSLLLGCIADDLTGATDVASALVSGGMRTVQVNGVPGDEFEAGEGVDALVVALKSRSAPKDEAVAQSLASLDYLRSRGARQIYFKYCSTFDSTDAGNIGPVADALLSRLGADFTLVCPAFPENKRTVRGGDLFVGDVLLSDSPMRHHPLTPMTDSNLVRVLGRQTPLRVGLVGLEVVRAGALAIAERISQLRAEGVSYAVADAVHGEDLLQLGRAAAQLKLVTGATGLARALPPNFAADGSMSGRADVARLAAVGGRTALLAGSCSEATRGQVAEWCRTSAAVRIEPSATAEPVELAARALADGERLAGPSDPVLYYSSAEPRLVHDAQVQLGRAGAGQLIERTFAELARMLVARGVRRLVVAGGETSGAVVGALGIQALRIGAEIAPGVPWTTSLSQPRLALALKSGNFGAPDFFRRALELQD